MYDAEESHKTEIAQEREKREQLKDFYEEKIRRIRSEYNKRSYKHNSLMEEKQKMLEAEKQKNLWALRTNENGKEIDY